ncbi:hypothetical protein MN608_01737 [Microdochium nivale]|nr:hypothetical protein MN608_01737 [Microdochium nivale]
MAPSQPLYNSMPSGVSEPSYESVAYTIYVPIAIFSILCPVAVTLKLWSRTRKGGTLGWDDLTNVLALVFALATGGVLLDCCAHGYGRHWVTLALEDQHEAMKLFYVSQVTYKTSINLTKASILLLYLRIFGSIRWFRYACAAVLSCVACYWAASLAGTVFQCTPVQRAFDPSVPGHCIDNLRFWYANAGFSIATDLVILVLPMLPVTTLEIPRVQKMALMFVFTLGIFVVVTSCLRITTIDIQAKTRDKTFDISSTMWTVIEMNVAIICSCLPQLRPLVVKLFPRLVPSYYFGSSREERLQQQQQQHQGRQRESRPFLGLSGGQGSPQQHQKKPEIQAVNGNKALPYLPGSSEGMSNASSDNVTVIIHGRESPPSTGDESGEIRKITHFSVKSTREKVGDVSEYPVDASTTTSSGEVKQDV